jgi:hypothetical protein
MGPLLLLIARSVSVIPVRARYQNPPTHAKKKISARLLDEADVASLPKSDAAVKAAVRLRARRRSRHLAARRFR